MRTLLAFIKKEIKESFRSCKLLILIGIFVILGIMNPVIAKLTPIIMEGALKESGMIMTEKTIDAMTSWTQFFKNIPIGLIAVIVMYSNSFTKEYNSGTLVMVLTKGLERYKVVIAKYVIMLLTWSICYWISYGITYGCNSFFWDNSVACNLGAANFNWWLFGVCVITIMLLFSVAFHSNIIVLVGAGVSVVVFYLLGMIPKIKEYSPTILINTASLLNGTDGVELYQKGIWVSVALIVICFIVSIPVMNNRRI